MPVYAQHPARSCAASSGRGWALRAHDNPCTRSYHPLYPDHEACGCEAVLIDYGKDYLRWVDSEEDFESLAVTCDDLAESACVTLALPSTVAARSRINAGSARMIVATGEGGTIHV